jgi:hypothetical protein
LNLKGACLFDFSPDTKSLTNPTLIDHGFVNVKAFEQGVCDDEMFLRPERDYQFGDRRFNYGLALECMKASPIQR